LRSKRPKRREIFEVSFSTSGDVSSSPWNAAIKTLASTYVFFIDVQLSAASFHFFQYLIFRQEFHSGSYGTISQRRKLLAQSCPRYECPRSATQHDLQFELHDCCLPNRFWAQRGEKNVSHRPSSSSRLLVPSSKFLPAGPENTRIPATRPRFQGLHTDALAQCALLDSRGAASIMREYSRTFVRPSAGS